MWGRWGRCWNTSAARPRSRRGDCDGSPTPGPKRSSCASCARPRWASAESNAGGVAQPQVDGDRVPDCAVVDLGRRVSAARLAPVAVSLLRPGDVVAVYPAHLHARQVVRGALLEAGADGV